MVRTVDWNLDELQETLPTFHLNAWIAGLRDECKQRRHLKRAFVSLSGLQSGHADVTLELRIGLE